MAIGKHSAVSLINISLYLKINVLMFMISHLSCDQLGSEMGINCFLVF